MQNPTPAPLAISDDQRRRDGEHVQLLSIFHFVVGGLSAAAIAFLCLHFLFFYFVFMNPEMWQGQKELPPREFFHVFIWFYVFMGVMFAAGAVVNVLSGLFMQRRTHRTFSLVVAGLDCLQMPFGTILGVFTIVVLTRDSVRASYEARAAAVQHAS
jgi:hypothetical protein